MSRRAIYSAPFLLLILLTFGFRVLQLDADPPADFSWSGGYFADEGFWSHNARNAVLFGDPVQDEWDARIVSPIFARLQELIFRFFGTGFIQVRLIAVLSSLVLAAISFMMFRKQFDAQKSFLFSCLISFNFPMMVLGRQGILDPFAAMLAWAAFFLLLNGSAIGVFISGVLLVGACVTKYLMLYTLLPFVFLVWRSDRKLQFSAGFAFALFLWISLNYLPNQELLSRYSSYYASQQSWHPVDVIKNVIQQPFYLYFVKTPAILVIANLMLWFSFLYFFQDRNKGWNSFSGMEKTILLWLLAGILFFALWKYRPFRYYASLIPPLAATAGIGLYRLDEISAWVKTANLRWLLYLGILLPALQICFVLVDRYAGWNYVPSQLGIHTLDAILLIGFTFIVVWALRGQQSRMRWIGWCFLLILLLSDARNYVTWMAKPQYQALQISKDLESVAKNGVLTGQWAPELCLANPLRSIPVWRGFVNSRDPFQQFGITHVLQWKYALGGEKFEDWYPEEFKQFRLIKIYQIKNSDLLLYQREEKHD